MVCAIFMRLGLSFSSFSWWLLNIFFNCFFVCVSCRFIPLYTVLGSGWISIYLFTLLFCCIGTFFRSLLYTCHANMRIPNRYICQWCNLLNLVRKKRSVLWMDGMMMARSEAFTIPWHSSPLMLEAHTNEWRSEIACSTLYRKCNIMTRDWQWHDLHLRNCSSFCIRMTRRFLLAFYLIFLLVFFIHSFFGISNGSTENPTKIVYWSFSMIFSFFAARSLNPTEKCNATPARLCKTRYNTTAPMYGVSLTSGQPVTIVQKFPDLLQQVVFEVCE